MSKYIFIFLIGLLAIARQEVIFGMPGQRVISERLVELIENSRSVDLCFYNFTHFQVAEAIVEKQKGDKKFARLIVDHNFKREHCEALEYLIENGVDCYVYFTGNSMNHIHCKFGCLEMEYGEDLVWHGSWNCTGSADINNIEVVTVTAEKNILNLFNRKFAEIVSSGETRAIELAECLGKKVRGKGLAKIINRIPRRLWHR